MRRGTTLTELAVVVAVLALVASTVIPMLSRQSGVALTAAETLLRDDLEQARHRTMAAPHAPVMLLVDEDQRGWGLVDAEDRNPILRSDGTTWSVRLGEGAAAGVDDVTIHRSDVPGARSLRFDATGVAIAAVPPRFEIRGADGARTIEVGLVSGLVRRLDGDD